MENTKSTNFKLDEYIHFAWFSNIFFGGGPVFSACDFRGALLMAWNVQKNYASNLPGYSFGRFGCLAGPPDRQKMPGLARQAGKFFLFRHWQVV